MNFWPFKNFRRNKTNTNCKQKNIVTFFKESPLYGLDLEFERDKSSIREMIENFIDHRNKQNITLDSNKDESLKV